MNLSEFDLIESYFKRDTTVQNSGVALGIGDDCALLDIPEGYQLAVSTDSLVCGVHFFEDVEPYRLGYKALAVNLSDLAAMGALPKWVSLAITLPNGAMVNNNQNWLAEFTRGFFALADKFGVLLVGGDTTKGPLSITLSVKGIVPRGLALQRNKANEGDMICVSNHIGNGALGLAVKSKAVTVTHPQYFVDALELTEPRVDLGILLRGLASSCIDISDGLTQDLTHILKASNCCAKITIESLPFSEMMQDEIKSAKLDNDAAVQYALTGGDDYELLFTVSESNLIVLEQILAQQTELMPSISVIGSITSAQPELISFFKDKQAVTYATGGWDHFKQE
ncbi:MAG: thiamine-monophosphate kinase [Psychromonas sp.]|jgi:thiamine-monophosphate kinase|uniref:thiamine-phosphate kinase n=1 Tax=Psychromonas sp. TaxID=1884585 RepID=UPI0039E262CA